jgi:ribosomal protein L11 methyltransferase
MAEVQKKWFRLSIQTPLPLVEAVSDLLGVLSGCGVEIKPEINDTCLVNSFFVKENGATEKKIINSLRDELKLLFELYGRRCPELTGETFADENWAVSWKQYFTAVEIVPGLIVKPSWESYESVGYRQGEQNKKIIELDPGQAFGTGQHESTRLALSLLSNCFKGKKIDRVLDVGTGTGILAMAAALFGDAQVTGIDNDSEAVRAAGKNVAANKLSRQISVSNYGLESLTGQYNLILANIVHNVLVEMAPLFRNLLYPDGMVILSGILTGEQEKSINRVYCQLGFIQIGEEKDGEWIAMLFLIP